MRGGAAALVLLLLLAGCSEEPAATPETTPGPLVEGWVVDSKRAPVVGASIAVEGQPIQGTTDAEGHYRFEAPVGIDLLVVVAADGYHPSSRLVPAYSGAVHVLNFSLQKVPDATPYHLASEFEGSVSCAFTVVLQEDPDRPHQHQGVRCTDLLPTQTHVWNYTIPTNATGLVLEGFWEAQTPASEALVVKAEVVGTGQVLAFVESMSPLRVQLSAANLAAAAKDGRSYMTVTVTPGAGTGSHEHGAIGLFVEQPFQLVMTAFFNGPVDPSFVTPR